MKRVQLSTNLYLDEFDCHDGTPVPQALVPNARFLATNVIQPIRNLASAALGKDTPIIVICGYRTLSHNAAVGGAPDSAHLDAEGGDIRLVSPAQSRWLHDLVLGAYNRKLLPALGGLGRYDGRWIHVDTRVLRPGYLRRWTGRGIASEPVLSDATE